jgi:diguanylate cyclase (GGDEF)-like protein
MTHLLVSVGSTERVLDAVADALTELVPYDTITVYQADNALGILRPVLVRDAWAQQILSMGPLPFGTGITGTAAQTLQPLLVNQAHLDPRAVQIPGTPEEPEAVIAVPIVAHDELKGVLFLDREGEGNGFDEEEFRLAIRFGEVAALALDNAETHARLEAEAATDHLTALHNHRSFHERLAKELRRASRLRSTVGLLLYDIDDFSRVNASFGHLVGDQVLQSVAAASREVCREGDVLCRVGGEEFAAILPGCNVEESLAIAERLRAVVTSSAFAHADPVTVSVGIACGPQHASAARDLVACADAALRGAKAAGKDRAHVWSHSVASRGGGREGVVELRPADLALGGEIRSVAHLKMLQSLAGKLNRLNDVERIGETITAELSSLIDYHNCRVHLLQPDGETLSPVAFRGELLEYQGETFDALLTKLGEGITGTVASTGESLYLPNAEQCEFAVQIPGTPEVDESILCVPMRYGERVIGTVALSKLGIDQFDAEDLRMLELLASHAAVAFENARLYQNERESAETSRALLVLSQRLTWARDVDVVLAEALDAIPALIPCSMVEAWVRTEAGDAYTLAAHRGYPVAMRDWLDALVIPAAVADPFIGSIEEPFVIPKELLATGPEEFRRWGGEFDVLGVPMRWEPGGLGGIAVVAREPSYRFGDGDIRLARGVADITSLAMGNAERFAELERTYVSTVEALANALEAKDEYTSDHARALAEMTLAVGSELGLGGEDLKRLEIAALFHDIGKIGVPSEIIRKPGPLTAQERRIMAKHPEIGEQILEPVPFLQPIRPIIRACHERWDGKGYPDGLAGEAIPLEARIVFVCDAYHAMTTDRPYRSALTKGEAVRRLKLASGTQFDPAIVAAFVRVHDRGDIHFHTH